jgi:hypothetical protein
LSRSRFPPIPPAIRLLPPRRRVRRSGRLLPPLLESCPRPIRRLRRPLMGTSALGPPPRPPPAPARRGGRRPATRAPSRPLPADGARARSVRPPDRTDPGSRPPASIPSRRRPSIDHGHRVVPPPESRLSPKRDARAPATRFPDRRSESSPARCPRLAVLSSKSLPRPA